MSSSSSVLKAVRSLSSTMAMRPQDYVKVAEAAYNTSIAAIPSVKSARLGPNGAYFKTVHSIVSLPEGKSLEYSTTTAKDFTTPPEPLPPNFLAQAKNGIRVEISKGKNEKGDDTEILRVYDSRQMRKAINLTELDLFGAVYFDAELGGIAMNADATKAAFVAEAKKPKNKAFFSAKKDEDALLGQEYAFREEFGEQMLGKSKPVIVVVDLAEYEVAVRAESELPEGWVPGQLCYAAGDVLVGMIAKTEPRRLGMVFCTNRPARIFTLTTSGEFKALTKEDGMSARLPRVSPDGKSAVWLERELSNKGFTPGPHQACYRIVRKALDDEKEAETVMEAAAGREKAGVYDGCLPERPFSESGRFLFANATLGDLKRPIVVDLQAKSMKVLQHFPGVQDEDVCCVGVVDVAHGCLLAVHSSPLAPQSVLKAAFNEETAEIVMEEPLTTKTVDEGLFTKLYSVVPTQKHPEKRYENVTASAFFVGPREKAKAPLILWIHGGPHSSATASFLAQAYYFNLLGYALLFVNYRGSLGAGNDSVESILGHVGDTDVKDCWDALQLCLADEEVSVDAENVFLYGGSHGGFLVTHLAGQYPDAFRAVATRNPVTNIASMAGVTDIPDWCYVEGGASFAFKAAGPELLKSFYEKSPIAHVEKVKAPMLLLVGSKDLRVPPSNSYEYYQSLKALGKEVEMHIYEDNHSLAKVPVDANVLINSALFFQKAMQK